MRRPLLATGFIVPIVFWMTLGMCAARFGTYSHVGNLVSELGAAATPTRWLFAGGLLVCAVMSAMFVMGLWRECRRARIDAAPVLLILSFTFSIAGAAIFPMPHRLHGLLGAPSGLLLLSPPLALVMWRRAPLLVGLRAIAVVSLVVMALGLTAFAPDLFPAYPGLKQRFFHAGWSLWFVGLSAMFLMRLRSCGANETARD